MTPDVIKAEYLGEYKIKVFFEDGKSGVVDFLPFTHNGGKLAELSNMDLFQNFKIDEELGVIVWANSIDIAPEVIYSKATGEPLPVWME